MRRPEIKIEALEMPYPYTVYCVQVNGMVIRIFDDEFCAKQFRKQLAEALGIES